MYFIKFFIFLCVVSTFCHILHFIYFIYYFDFSRRALRQYCPQFLATKSGRVVFIHTKKKRSNGDDRCS